LCGRGENLSGHVARRQPEILDVPAGAVPEIEVLALDVPQEIRAAVRRIKPAHIGDLRDLVERPQPAGDVPGPFEHERRGGDPEGKRISCRAGSTRRTM
jgi:hypothetical protein